MMPDLNRLSRSRSSSLSFTMYLFTAISLAATNCPPSVRYGTINSKFHCKVKDAEH